MFDCVIPTRNARNGLLFTRRGNVKIKLKFKSDFSPIEENCLQFAHNCMASITPSTAEHIFTTSKNK